MHSIVTLEPACKTSSSGNSTVLIVAEGAVGPVTKIKKTSVCYFVMGFMSLAATGGLIILLKKLPARETKLKGCCSVVDVCYSL